MDKQIVSIDKFISAFPADSELISKAVTFVKSVNAAENHVDKAVEVASILQPLNIDQDTLVAAILSAPCMALAELIDDISGQFGDSIARLVKDVNSLNQLQLYSPDMVDQPSQAEILRRMLLSVINDARAVLIKLAYRVHRLRYLPAEGYEIRHFIARETLDIYAPIANRMGVSQIKWELEDLSFRYLHPQEYLKLAKSLDVSRKQREQIIQDFTQTLTALLKQANVQANMAGRPKHIYSIWKKMQRKEMLIDELYDLLAVRVLVKELSECYTVLGLVHGEWSSIPKEFDDYISNPKGNGYQSLHTVIVNPEGHRIEVQIRTEDMHEFAEFGVAAHWRYKEGSKQNKATEENIAALRQLLAEINSDRELVDNFQADLFDDRVYVLTPEGRLVDLMKGATPLDFAYAIHTEVGHRCRGAKVNGRIVPLTYHLSSGEQVEILTAKIGEPNRHWIDLNLGYLKTSRAINKVKSWFKHQDDEKNIVAGRLLLEKELQQMDAEFTQLNKLYEYFNKQNIELLYLAIGRGEISLHQLLGFFNRTGIQKHKAPRRKNKTAKARILIDGLTDVVSSIAQCCQPEAGEEIIGFISHFKGITIHRSNCQNIKHLSRQQQTQLIQASWQMDDEN